jgi:ParB/RepB/Spo0J family partition protein
LILCGKVPPYRIIDGFRRAEALAGLGEEFVSAIVRDDISDVDAFSLSFIDNVKRRNLSSVDKANAIWLALNRERISKNDIAISFGVSLRQISRYLQLLEFDEAIQTAVADSRITMAHAVVLSRENPHSPLEMIDRIEREKISVPQLKKLFTSSARPGRTPSYIVREGNGFHLRPIRYYPSMPPTKIKQIAQALQQALELIHRSKLERS